MDKLDTLTFPHGVTVTRDRVEYDRPAAQYDGRTVLYTEYTAYRANGTRRVASIVQYEDGRTMAQRHLHNRGTLDATAWAGVNRTLGGDSSDFYRGLKMPGNPAE